MRNIKKAIVMLFVMIMLLMSGCSGHSDLEWSNLRNAYYKNDVYSYSGQFCAVNNDRIYYISNEDEGSGIFSMDLNGEDIRFELDTPKVIKLIVKDDKIYYIGLSHKTFRRQEMYGFFEYDRDKNETLILMEGDKGSSVQNAIVTKDDSIFTRVILGMGSSKAAASYLCDVNIKTNESIVSKELLNVGDSPSMTYKITKYNGYIISIVDRKYVPFKGWDYIIANSNDALYNIETGETLMFETPRWKNCVFKVTHTNSNNIYAAYRNQLIICDKNTLDEINKISFDGIDEDTQLDYTIESENKLYLIFTNEDNTQKLIAMDVDAYEYVELMDLDNQRVLINIQDGGILFAEGDKVYFLNVTNDGLGETEYYIELESDIVNNNIFEVAANWLFIYDRGNPRETTPLELLYKVNLDTQEIIENE